MTASYWDQFDDTRTDHKTDTMYDGWSKLLKTKNVHTLRPLSDLVSIMVRTVSYKMALPTFLLVSVFVATWPKKTTQNNNFTIVAIYYYINIHVLVSLQCFQVLYRQISHKCLVLGFTVLFKVTFGNFWWKVLAVSVCIGFGGKCEGQEHHHDFPWHNTYLHSTESAKVF